MHPFQDQVNKNQVNKIWEFIQKRSEAIKTGKWIEAISLTYTLYEIELRLLLSSKTGNKEITAEQIENQKNLMNLANLAKDTGFIGQIIWDRLQEFNKGRINTIYSLAQGKIEYEQIGEVIKKASGLFHDIQNCLLPITLRKKETPLKNIKTEPIITNKQKKKGTLKEN